MRGWAWLLSLGALLLVSGCDGESPVREAQGGPALWRVQRGSLDGTVFGTIHVLPKGVAWETQALRAAMTRSDRLVLEAATLDDEAATLATFERIGRSPGLPPVADRIAPQDRATLTAITAQTGADMQALTGYESWAAAMLLSAATQQALKLSDDNGVEPALTQTFRSAGKPLAGLETVEEQFAAFDTLPEAAQRRMLTQTVREAKNMGLLYDRILTAWLKGDLAAIAREEEGSEPPDPMVKAAVLTARNRKWADEIAAMNGRPFIAVGVGHLTGRDNLIAMLEARGFTVTRVQ